VDSYSPLYASGGWFSGILPVLGVGFIYTDTFVQRVATDGAFRTALWFNPLRPRDRPSTLEGSSHGMW
jgi:hypothetical protein